MTLRGDERGWVTLWGAGLAVALLVLGALVVDVWRVFTERQELGGLADSAAIAGATAIDQDVFRNTGDVILDVTEAPMRADQYLAANASNIDDPFTAWITIVGAPPNDMLSVTLTKDFEFAVLGPFVDDDNLNFSITAFAQPGERIGP